jgi:hypothetical protein
MNRRLLTYLLPSLPTACLLALTGCSGGPSEDEMKQALQRQTTAALAGNILGSVVQPEIKSVRKIGCEKSGSAYLCDVEVEAGAKGFGSQKSTSRMRFIEGKDGWRASQ